MVRTVLSGLVRLFVAAWPPPAVVEELGRLPRAATAGMRWTTSDQWHVTLRFLGQVADAGAVADALAAARLPAARAELGPSVVRIDRHVAAFPVAGLDRLAASVVDATAAFGQRPRRRFRGHLTIARSRRGHLEATTGLMLTAAWDVRAVDLVRAELHPDGARYRPVASFALTGV
jgi:RNA 2',3'-cyclic 3'-phosphodiesterase